MEIPEIVTLLNDRIYILVGELLPLGRQEAAEWVEASRDDGGLGDSLTVRLTGDKVGVWKHFAADVGGDALDLIAYLRFDGRKGDALRWARGWLGIDNLAPAALKETRRKAEKAAETSREAQEASREKRARQARAIWLSGVPIKYGDPVDDYLSGRGIRLWKLGHYPGAIRYLSECWCSEIRAKLPAMVTAINGPDGKIAAVHRTYLRETIIGQCIKADLKSPKMVLGPYAGGAARIWRGEAIDAETGEISLARPLAQAGPGQEVVICEGIEDALTLAQAAPQRRIMAAISVGNIGQVALPKNVAAVILVADNDAAGTPASAAFDKAVAAHQAAGRRVKVARAPSGYKDVNDFLNNPPENE